jgi:tape measure domain-containing protein
MTFIAGELAAVIRLDGKQAVDAGIASTGQKFTALKSITDGVGAAVSNTFRSGAVAINITAAATAALVGKVVATGLAYNQLQQTSRTALKTLLGGAEAANAQMDKLDAFARNSPFSKAVFITAQQQLIGFGVAAEKVVPILDAIQQAVAATGGSSEDIGTIAAALAGVSSAGKITGMDLDILAARGIDAATIIGSQMGLTGQEIRDEITAGTLDAGLAIDALTVGLSEKFAGASAGVKEQFAGAADRVKAAWRDIGAALAEPFISKNGGGQAVIWANQVADVLRALEKKAAPFTDYVVGRLQPAISGVSTLLITAKNVVNDFDLSVLTNGFDKLGQYAPQIGLVAGAVAALGTNIPVISALGLSINPVLGGLIGLAAASPDVRNAAGVMWDALQPLGGVFSGLASDLNGGVNLALAKLADGIRFVAREAGPVMYVANHLDTLASYAPALGGLLGVLLSFSPVGGILASVGLGMNPLLAGLIGVVATSPEARGALLELGQTLLPLVPLVAQVANVFALSLNAALPLVADGIELVTAVARPIVDVLTAIPAPVLAGVVAFLALHNALKPLGSATGIASTALNGLKESLEASKATSEAFGGGVGVVGQASALASSGVASLGNSLKAAFLSNPIGIALTLISTAVSIWAMANSAAEEKVQAHTKTVAALRDTLNETSGAITAATTSTVNKNLADAKADELAKKIGISYKTVQDAAMGNTAAMAAVEAATKKYDEANKGNIATSTGSTAAMNIEQSASHDLKAAINEQASAVEDAQKSAAKYRAELAEASAAMSDAARSNSRLNDAIATARDTSKDAATRLNALKDALDELRGGTVSTAEAQARLNESNLTLIEGLAQTDEAGTKLWASMVSGTGTLDTTTRAGLAFYDQLKQSNDGMLSAQQAAYDLAVANGDVAGAQDKATAAGEAWIGTLRQTLTDAGLTSEQVEGLISQYMSVPDTVSTLITDNGSISLTEQGLLALATQINATPDKTVTITEPMSPEIRQRLIDLGYIVTTLPNGSTTVSAPGASEALSILQQINAEAQSRQVQIDVLVNRTETLTQRGGGIDGSYPSSENGNLFNHNTESIQAFANGGFPTGIYRGRPGGILKFAEENVNWEAFVSGKVGQEGRNRKIVMEAGRRLGMEVVPQGQQRPTAFADGGAVTRGVWGPGPSTPAAREVAASGPQPIIVQLVGDAAVLAQIVDARVIQNGQEAYIEIIGGPA